MPEIAALEGKRIVVTRNLESAGRLSGRLRELGAEVLELPLIEIRYEVQDKQRLADVFQEISQYEWLVFTSAHGVRGFFEAFTSAFEDIRSLGLLRIAVVGDGTAGAVQQWHLKVDLQPEEATGDALAKALSEEQTLDNLRVLVVTGNRNRPNLVDQLNKAQAIVDTLEVYQTSFTELEGEPAAAAFRRQGADVLIFSSSSAVESFGHQAQYLKLDEGARVPALASFGPLTTATMKKAQIPVSIEAETPGIEPMVEAVVQYFRGQLR